MWPRNWFDACGLLLCLALSPVLLNALLRDSLGPLFVWVAALVVYLAWEWRREVDRE